VSGFIVGLTGGIGSGKTAVAACFAAEGAAVVDTDGIAHELTAPGGEAMAALVQAFGSAVRQTDGGLDRAAMRALVFADPVARGRLESILHPLIRQAAFTRCRAASSPYVILAVPLLVETGVYRGACDRVLVVDCDDALRIARVGARSGLGEAEVRAVMAAQATREARLAAATEVLHNDGALDRLGEKVRPLHRKYLELAAAKLQAAC
jgi:dephospho-CoA kinase